MSRKSVRVIFAVISIAAMGSLVQGQGRRLPSAPDVSSAFPLGINPVTAANAEGEWNGGPRECDVLNGISTACIFMD